MIPIMDRLLELLQSNARMPVADLARAVDSTEAEVAARIAAWEADGTILGYQTLIEPEKICNGDVEAVIEIKITPERGGGFDRLARRIAQFEEVTGCYLMSGGFDLLIIVRGRNLQSVARFIAERLSTIQGVLSTATHFRLKAYKENGILLHRPEPSDRLAVSP